MLQDVKITLANTQTRLRLADFQLDSEPAQWQKPPEKMANRMLVGNPGLPRPDEVGQEGQKSVIPY